MQARRPRLAELGVFLLVVALMLIFTPFSTSPFGDPKLVVLSAASLCLVAAGLPWDRRTALAGGVLVGVATLAGLFGVEPTKGLTAQADSTGTGLILFVCIAVLASIGAALPPVLRHRSVRWYIGGAAAVAVVGIAYRLASPMFEELFPDKGMIGSTMGNQVFAVALTASALGALLTTDPGVGPRAWWITLVVLAGGIASFGQRSSIAFVVIAIVVALWRRPDARRRIWKAAVVVAMTMVVWLALSPLMPSPGRVAAELQTLSNERQRLVLWRVGLESFADRPLLGWGPGSTRSAYLANASPADIDITTRRYGDAHNVIVATLTEMGSLGLLAMAALGGLLVWRARARSTERAAAFTVAAILLSSWLIEPAHPALTPLLFFFMAIAGPVSDDASAGERRRIERVVPLVAATLLMIATAVTVQMLVAATLERWGRTYGETWALEGALRIQPWRLSSAQRLAVSWALDGRAGDEAAADRARELIAEAVDDHPWDPDVRLVAADVETLLRHEAAAEAWIQSHIERFPGDAEGLARAEIGGSLPTQNASPGA
ncbi:MAG TPA: O-antigen ligase family protein [Actinomycetota bacterium]